MICISGDVSDNIMIHRALRSFVCSSRHVVLVINRLQYSSRLLQLAQKLAFQIL